MSKSAAARGARIVSWSEVAAEARKVNPEFADIIDAISPDKSLRLVEVSFGYGDKILNHGRLEKIEVVDPGVSKEKVNELLDYASYPLGLQLKNASEMYLEIGERILPLELVVEGALFGLFEALVCITGCTSAPVWSMTAGSRSAFMLPKITDTRSHNRLKAEFGFYQSAPNKLSDHAHVFKAITNSPRSGCQWTNKVLFFTKDWFQTIHQSSWSWLNFYNFILVQAWLYSRHLRMKNEFSPLWESFAAAIRHKNLKPGPYLMDTVKHLISCGMGYVPGFMPIGEQEQVLPARLIEYAYSEIYQLKEYAPTILFPYRLDKNNPHQHTVYYSMGMPSLLEGTPTIRKAPSIITELREIKRLLNIFHNVVQEESPANYALLKDVRFEYYHSENDPFGEIKHSLEIGLADKIINESLSGRFEGKEFATHGQFLRGCISLTKLAETKTA